jgi:hypothetical protein
MVDHGDAKPEIAYESRLQTGISFPAAVIYFKSAADQRQANDIEATEYARQAAGGKGADA